MTLINKIGLIGLLGVVALIVIYLIRPNYQQKTVSSTYVWKLSLKKKKKKVPVSKIRNLLLFLCQMLALTCLAMVLMKPAIVLKTPSEISEAILIIDTSASMRTKSAETETTRFERAVTQADEQAKQVLRGGGTLSVALAGDDTDFLFKQISGDGAAATVSEALKGLDMQNFGYGSANIDGALKECEDILYGNPDAMIYVYTDASYYTTPNGIQVVNVAEEGEWNAAILDARAVWDDGYYSFTVQVACYGKDARLSLNMRVYGVNGEAGKSLNYTVAADCSDNETTTLIFRYRKDGEAADTNVKNQQVFDLGNLGGSDQTKINSFSSVHLSFSGDMEDCYALDDNFDVFGGQKQTLKVQYASAEPNPFVNGVISNLRSDFADSWDIQPTEVKKGEAGATQGFDLYIFERTMPEKMPTDGVVFLLDPVTSPENCGFTRSSEAALSPTNGKYPSLFGDTEHAVMKNVDPNYIRVSRYQVISNYDAGYQVLMSLNKLPMLMVRNDMPGGAQTLVMNFSFAYSNLGILPEFYLLMKNSFEYFFPATVEKYVFSVGEKAELNARGTSLSITGGDFEEPMVITEFPATITLSVPGTYTLKQTTYYGTETEESVYVKMPEAESNITEIRSNLYNPDREKNEADYYKDVLTYIAAALVALLFLEWCLHLKDGV